MCSYLSCTLLRLSFFNRFYFRFVCCFMFLLRGDTRRCWEKSSLHCLSLLLFLLNVSLQASSQKAIHLEFSEIPWNVLECHSVVYVSPRQGAGGWTQIRLTPHPPPSWVICSDTRLQWEEVLHPTQHVPCCPPIDLLSSLFLSFTEPHTWTLDSANFDLFYERANHHLSPGRSGWVDSGEWP